MNEFLLSKKSLFFYFILIVAFYWDTQNAGFVTDFLGWQTSFDNNSFWQILHASDRGIKSFYHLTHLQMYAMSALFGMWGLPWLILFAGLFALNAWLVGISSIRLLNKLNVLDKDWAVFIGILCFILSPYQAEVMVWRASFHYLTAFAMLLIFLNLTVSYLTDANQRLFYLANLLYFCSLFALEFFFITPILSAVVILFWHFSIDKLAHLKQILARFVALPILSLMSYFVAYHAVYGKWIAHYGAGTHLRTVSLAAVVNYSKYLVKHLLLVRYYHIFDYDIQKKLRVYGFLEQPMIAWCFAIALIGIIAFSLLKFSKIAPLSKFKFLCFIFFSTLLLPVLPMFYYDLYLTENDRLGFMASAFLFVLIALMLSQLPKRLFFSLSVLYLSANIFLLIQTTQLWFKSERVCTSLIKSFHWWDADEVMVLNLPDNMNGMYMFRHFGATSSLPESLAAYHKRKKMPKMYDVKRYNMISDTDGVSVKVDSMNHLTVKLNQFGNWWQYETTAKTEIFEVENIEMGYRLKLIPTDKKRIVLYQVSGEWREVVF
jgi:hypothetical protein